MSRPAWLHNCALLLGICCLAGIAVGAWVSGASWPLPGADAQHATTLEPAVAASTIHLILGSLIVLLSLATGIGAMKSEHPMVRSIGWLPFVLSFVAAGTVSPTAIAAARPAMTLLHAACANLVIAFSAAIWALTGSADSEPLEDTWKPSLGTLSLLVPGLVLLQIVLGASFRREMINVLWHVMNALVVLTVNLVVAVCLVKQFSSHKALRSAATGLIIVTGTQVVLGFAAYIAVLVSRTINYPLAILGSIHAFTGSLVMAAATIVAVQIRRAIAAK